MTPELDEGVPAFRYRSVLAFASAVSFVSIVVTFLAWFLKDENRLLGVLVLLPVFVPYGFVPLPRNLLNSVRHHLGQSLVGSQQSDCGSVDAAGFASCRPKGVYRFAPFTTCRSEILAGPAYGFSLLALFLWLHSPVPRYITMNEHSTMKSLQTSAVYFFWDAESHGRLYPEAVSSLAPNSSRACTVELKLPPSDYFFGLLSRICGLIPVPEAVRVCDTARFPSHHRCGTHRIA